MIRWHFLDCRRPWRRRRIVFVAGGEKDWRGWILDETEVLEGPYDRARAILMYGSTFLEADGAICLMQIVIDPRNSSAEPRETRSVPTRDIYSRSSTLFDALHHLLLDKLKWLRWPLLLCQTVQDERQHELKMCRRALWSLLPIRKLGQPPVNLQEPNIESSQSPLASLQHPGYPPPISNSAVHFRMSAASFLVNNDLLLVVYRESSNG